MRRVIRWVCAAMAMALALSNCGDDEVEPSDDECHRNEDCTPSSPCATATCEGEPLHCVEHVDCACACTGLCGLIELGGCECPGCGCGEECLDNHCEFTACDGLECGSDGCGGTCGDCSEIEICEDGSCVAGQIFVVNPSGSGACSDTDPYCNSIQEAIDTAPDGAIIRLRPGTYSEVIDIDGREGLRIEGPSSGDVLLQPESTISWAIPGFSQYDSRRTAFRIYGSTDIALAGVTVDLDGVKGNNVAGVLIWDSTASIEDNTFQDMNGNDLDGIYNEIAIYVRAESFTDQQRAEVIVSGNTFSDTGRVGVLTHGFVHALIEGNTFEKTEEDFGYAIEMGTQSSGRVAGNVISGFATPAASDGSASAGILIDNSFSAGLSDLAKLVEVESNDVFDNQMGIMIGNSWNGLGGDVAVRVVLRNNEVHGNLENGVAIVDEDREAGSSVTVSASGNHVFDNVGAGYYLYTLGDGDITASIEGDTISGNAYGIVIQEFDDALLHNSLYNVQVHHNLIVDNREHHGLYSGVAQGVSVRNNWWGCNAGPLDDTSQCDLIEGATEPGNHLILKISTNRTAMANGETAEIYADIRFDCHGGDTTSLGCISDGLPVHFGTNLGHFGGQAETDAEIQGGIARATLSAGDTPGTATVTATLDHEAVSAEISISAP